MGEPLKHFYEFGRFSVNTAERVLLRDGEVVPLTPKVFDILITLVESSGQVVSKDGLMKKVWPDSFVEEGNLTQNISLLRKALGEGQNGNQFIETVARRGYRFTQPVRELTETDHHQQLKTHGVPISLAQAAPRIESDARAGIQGYWVSNLKRHRAVAVAGLSILTLAAAAIIYFAGGGKPVNGSSSVIESIAVMPFVNEASDTDAEYF